MKKIILIISLLFLLSNCSSDNDFNVGKKQLKAQGYTQIVNTGWSPFSCAEDDTFSTGFTAVDKDGNKVEGVFCGGLIKGVTIRYTK